MINQLSIRKIATKSDLKKLEKILRAEILKVEEKVESVEEKVESVEEKVESLADNQKSFDVKIDRVLNTLDTFLGRIDNLEVDNEIGANQIRELQVQTDKHEKRITKLESAIQ